MSIDPNLRSQLIKGMIGAETTKPVVESTKDISSGFRYKLSQLHQYEKIVKLDESEFTEDTWRDFENWLGTSDKKTVTESIQEVLARRASNVSVDSEKLDAIRNKILSMAMKGF